MTEIRPDERLYFNGIHARKDPRTGLYKAAYNQAPANIEEFNRLIIKNPPVTKDRFFKVMEDRQGAHFKLGPPGADEQSLAEMGWGIVFPAGMDPKKKDAILEALEPLTSLRKQEAGKLYKEFSGPQGVLPSDTAEKFLKKFNLGPSSSRPEIVPSYLVLVGGPEEISFRVQYQLDVVYYVGRLHFDTPEEYHAYAQAIVMATDPQKVRLDKKASFFGPDNQGDRATKQSSEILIKQLARQLSESKNAQGWKINPLEPAECTHQRLEKLLGGQETPALLVTASHGMVFDKGDPDQQKYQGALVCQDYATGSDLRRQDFFAAEDLATDANLLGTIAFLFACYGAGTPQNDNFTEPDSELPLEIAPQPFLSGLPRAMLSRGALGVLGHVDRAWTYSFQWKGVQASVDTFKFTLESLMMGKRIGTAFDYFNEHYSEVATLITEALSQWDGTSGVAPDPYELAWKWTAHNDARDYILLGDPAAKLPALSTGEPALERPTVTVLETPTPLKTEAVPVSTPPEEAKKAPAVTDEAFSAGPVTVPALTSTSLPAGAYTIQIQTDPDGKVAITLTPGQVTVKTPQPGLDAAEDFGLRESLGGLRDKLSEAQKALGESLEQALKKLGQQAKDFTEEVTTLEVETYSSRDLRSLTYDPRTKDYLGGEKRAWTRIELDGDTKLVVPTGPGGMDKELWAIHTQMVEQALNYRTAMIKAMAEVITGLIPGGGS